MVVSTFAVLRRLANTIKVSPSISYWCDILFKKYSLYVSCDANTYDFQLLTRQLYYIFLPVPSDLVKSCGIKRVVFRTDMGPNRAFYPNHGFFKRDLVVLNADIFYHPDQPDDFFDHRGYFVTRGQQTVLHEFGHGYDYHHGDLSLQPSWMTLSGWSNTFKPGLKRLVIDEPGTPKVIGEQYFDPHAKFTRFYAARNSWDDFADSFSFYLAGLKDKIPDNKRRYFDNLLGHYYKNK